MDPKEKKEFLQDTELKMSFINQLRKWCSEGDRTVEIKLKNRKYGSDKPLTIWVYDSETSTSCFIETIDDIPDEVQVLEKRLRYLEDSVAKTKKLLQEKEK